MRWKRLGEDFATAPSDGREAALGLRCAATPTGLSTGKYYMVVVIAVNGEGKSETSNTAWGFPRLGEGEYGS